MNVAENLKALLDELGQSRCSLVAVTKTKSPEIIMKAFDKGHRDFGENRAQELTSKAASLPTEIRWHMIGHLQSNKVKYIAPFVHLIHSVDSLKLLQEINRQAMKNERIIECLLQVRIAEEDTKFGMEAGVVREFVVNPELHHFTGIRVKGLMGMGTFSSDDHKTRREFRKLKALFEEIKELDLPGNVEMSELSMGMSGDYKIAVEEGSTMVRVGSAIFGPR